MNKGFPPEIKETIYEAQNGYCGKEGCYSPIHSFHHKLPQSNFYQKKYPLFVNAPMNCIGLCEKCHSNFAHEFKITDKLAKVFEEWLTKLKGGI